MFLLINTARGGIIDETALETDYGTQSSDGCWDSSSSEDYTQELVNVTYDVNRHTLQYVNGSTATEVGGDGFNFFSPTCDTISVVSKECWVPAANASWPNAMYNPHMQNYTFIAETDVNGTLAYHFRADEKNISGDSGSLFLGCIVSVYAIYILNNDYIIKETYDLNKVIYVFSILTYPIIDLVRVFFIRIFRGKSPFIADKNHIHHILIKKYNSHKAVVLVIYIVNIIILLLLQIIF